MDDLPWDGNFRVAVALRTFLQRLTIEVFIGRKQYDRFASGYIRDG